MSDPGRPELPSPAELGRRLRERLASLREEIDRLRIETDRWSAMVAHLSDPPAPVPPVSVPGAADARGPRGAVFLESVRRLDAATGQVELLTRFLDECLRHASRAALLVERGGRMEPWKSVGFAASPGETAAAGTLELVRRGQPQLLGPGNEVSRALGAADAAAAVLFPFVVRETVSGALYADVREGETEKLDDRALSVLTFAAGIAVDRLAKRKLVPSPALGEPAGRRAPPAVPAREAPVAEEPPSFASPPPPDHPGAPLPESEAVPAPPPAVQLADGSALAGPLAPLPENERREEARRFARLLATEIKLYNEEAVSEGIERGNLYALLKGEIERGRRLYEERVAAEVRSESDYYQEELVDVLAGGRGELLR